MKKKQNLPHWIRLVLFATICFVTSSIQAFAGGGQHYPNGNADFHEGMFPPSGFYFQNYTEIAKKDRLTNNSGDTAAVDLNVDVFTTAPRFIWSSPYSLFGATYGAAVLVPIYRVDQQVNGPGGSSLVDSDDAGLGDLVITPFILGYHLTENLHMVLAMDVTIPTGDYDSDIPASTIISRNHWTFEPVFAITYLWDRFDFSGKFMYDFHSENDEYVTGGQKYKLDPGQEFHIDWAIGYALSDRVRLGLVGYDYWQTTDDELDGVNVEDGKSQIHGIGPGIKWSPSPKYSFTLKHYWEYAAENNPEGHVLKFKFAMAF